MEIEKEMKEVFDFYSISSGDDSRKTVSISQIQEIVTKIGLNVSEEDLKKKAGASLSDRVDYPTFVNLFSKEFYEGTFFWPGLSIPASKVQK